ncbi:MAG: Mur ligase family protein [Acidimicrobiales bacterium]
MSHARRPRPLGVELIVAPSSRRGRWARRSRIGAAANTRSPRSSRRCGDRSGPGSPIRNEFDLARLWDDRPIVTITGTNGKTTVTMLVTEALERSGRHAVAVGNTEVPLVEALDDPTVDVFVVEASSFRLGHTGCFAPAVAAWLNLAPDHLDNHGTAEAYEAAKAAIWRSRPRLRWRSATSMTRP